MKHDSVIERLLASGLFRVDSDGSIWTRKSLSGHGLPLGTWRRAEFSRGPNDYLIVCFENTELRAHRIVYRWWFGMLDPARELNHKNGVKSDNRPENLEEVTRSENLKHAYRTGLNRGAGRGSQNKNAKLNEEQVAEIHRLRALGWRHIELASHFDASIGNIANILAGRAWSHMKSPEVLH